MVGSRLLIEWLAWAVALIVIIGGHLAWLLRCNDPMIAQRLGAALIVLGIAMAARPFMRAGLKTSVDHALPGGSLPYYASNQMLDERRARQEAARPTIVSDMLAEKVIGVSIIVIGTLTNGYGDLLAKMLGVGQ